MKKAIQWTRGERIAGWSAFAGLFALAFLTLFATITETRPLDLEAGSDLVLPQAKLKVNKLFLFRYHLDTASFAPLAVQKGPDGVIRVAFSACRRCYRSGSYEWFGKLICGHCRHVMKLPDSRSEIETTKSGCALPGVVYAVEPDRLVVRGMAIRSEFSTQFGVRP